MSKIVFIFLSSAMSLAFAAEADRCIQDVSNLAEVHQMGKFVLQNLTTIPCPGTQALAPENVDQKEFDSWAAVETVKSVTQKVQEVAKQKDALDKSNNIKRCADGCKEIYDPGYIVTTQPQKQSPESKCPAGKIRTLPLIRKEFSVSAPTKADAGKKCFASVQEKFDDWTYETLAAPYIFLQKESVEGTEIKKQCPAECSNYVSQKIEKIVMDGGCKYAVALLVRCDHLKKSQDFMINGYLQQRWRCEK